MFVIPNADGFICMAPLLLLRFPELHFLNRLEIKQSE